MDTFDEVYEDALTALLESIRGTDPNVLANKLCVKCWILEKPCHRTRNLPICDQCADANEAVCLVRPGLKAHEKDEWRSWYKLLFAVVVSWPTKARRKRSGFEDDQVPEVAILEKPPQLTPEMWKDRSQVEQTSQEDNAQMEELSTPGHLEELGDKPIQSSATSRSLGWVSEDSFHPTFDYPPPDRIEELWGYFEDYICPWMPIFFNNAVENLKTDRLLTQAITVATIKFTNLPLHEQQKYYQGCLDAVVHVSHETITIEVARAMVVIGFEMSGKPNVSATSLNAVILGLLMDLQNEEQIVGTTLTTSAGFWSQSSQSQADCESRRRLFWSMFLMDKLLSTLTNSAGVFTNNVNRRLPIRDEKANTYFNNDEVLYCNIDRTKPPLLDKPRHVMKTGYCYLIESTGWLQKITSFLREIRRNESETHEKLLRLQDDMRMWHKSFPLNILKRPDAHRDPNFWLAEITRECCELCLWSVYFMDGFQWKTGAAECLEVARSCVEVFEKFFATFETVVVPQFAAYAYMVGRIILVVRPLLERDVSHKLNLEGAGKNVEKLIDLLAIMATRWTGTHCEENLFSLFHARLSKASQGHMVPDLGKCLLQDEGKLQGSEKEAVQRGSNSLGGNNKNADTTTKARVFTRLAALEEIRQQKHHQPSGSHSRPSTSGSQTRPTRRART
jgi:hypothetical protein